MSTAPAAPSSSRIEIGPLREDELEEANRIMRLAFGTFIGLAKPLEFAADRNFISPRFGAPNVRAFAARDGGRLIGSNLATRWGSFGFFGPLTVAPDYWGRGIGQQLLEPTMTAFDAWGLRRTGLFTFPHSAKHLCLYQKFGYWPGYLTAIMVRTPPPPTNGGHLLLSGLSETEREAAIESCAELTETLDNGLDLTDEIRNTVSRQTGDVVLVRGKHNEVDAFAVCATGEGSEGGTKTCYVKFGGARNGPGVHDRFEKLLNACESFAHSRGVDIEAGVNLAREAAYKILINRGYRITVQGLSMQRPHEPGLNSADAFVLDDLR